MNKIKIIIITLITLILLYITPAYNELNNIAIIESIGISYKNNIYTIYLKEIIPIKENNGINFKYKYYKIKTKNLKKGLIKNNNISSKHIYINKTKNLITNTKFKNKFISELDIKPNKIYYTKNVYKKIKTT